MSADAPTTTHFGYSVTRSPRPEGLERSAVATASASTSASVNQTCTARRRGRESYDKGRAVAGLGEPGSCVGLRERGCFQEYWPFREDARGSAVNQEAEKFEVNSFAPLTGQCMVPADVSSWRGGGSIFFSSRDFRKREGSAPGKIL
jgi:hypothetical protein